jgi:transglutaminase-like putative cysteine protease
MIGFSTRVDLGSVGKLRSDPTIAMRVHLTEANGAPASRLALYLRGTSFDHYDGSAWTRTRPLHQTLQQDGNFVWIGGGPRGALAMTVDLEPINPPIVFLPADAVGFRVMEPSEGISPKGPKLTGAADGEYKYERVEERGLQYAVYRGRTRPGLLGSADLDRYLQVPDPIRDQLTTLAKQWSSGLTQDRDLAHAIEEHLRTDYRYDLDSPSGAAAQPLLHFLFVSKAGHCEFYSTAMAVLLRTLHVPTRNVTGFIGGTYNRFGDFYAVRQGDAHSWVEVYLDGAGWTRYDPTPPLSSAPRSEMTGLVAFLRDVIEAAAQRWSRHVIGYDLDQQIELFRSVKQRYHDWGDTRFVSRLKPLVPVLGALIFAGLLYFAWRRLRLQRIRVRPGQIPGQPAAVTRVVFLYRQLEEVLRAQNLGRPASTPPLAHARSLFELNHPLAPEVLALTEIYLSVRFGRCDFSGEDERDFDARVKAMRHFRVLPERAA